MLHIIFSLLICSSSWTVVTDNKATRGLTPDFGQLTATAGEELYDSFTDVAYGDAQGRDNLMDAYLPKGRNANTKILVYIHGGSWKYGDKKEFPKAMIDELVGKRKYGLASINYRLIRNGQNTFPAQIEDVKKALAFISSYAAEYNYDGNHFTLMGASAGAHLALLYAYGYDEKKQVQSVIDIFGPTDLTDPVVRKAGSESNDIIESFLADGKTDDHFVRRASPFYQLTAATAVPTLIFHGTADSLVHISQSEKLQLKLEQLKVPVVFHKYPGKKHELPPDMAIDVFSKMIEWLHQYYPAQ